MAKKYVELDNFISTVKATPRCDLATALMIANNYSTADVVEVVRCKDCQYAWSNIEERPDFAWCNYYNTAGEDYCPYGTKMDGKPQKEV